MSCFLNVVKSFTGDCTNSSIGAINVEIAGSAPDYTIQWIAPASLGTIALGAGVTGYTQTGLSGGTYTFNVIDTCSPTSTIFPINVYISTGTCVSITSTQDTTCNFENGSLTASTQNVYNGNAEFYLYHNTLGYITSGESFTNTYFFDSLSAGTYYVIANDGGGCTGKSETCIVKTSTQMDFGFFVVNNAGCTGNTGKLYITGLTGNPPYTYLWQDNSTNDFITNLPSGNYSVQVTDSSGCVITKSVNVLDVPQIGVVSFTSVNPDCFVNNGSVTVYTSGGTLPFYYSGSNGYTIVTYDTEFTFNNLGSGLFSVLITDAALCTANGTTSLMIPQGFSIVDIGIQNSTCNNFSGALNPINIFGPSQPYTYTLTYPDGVTTDSVTVNSTNWSFDGLSSGTYTLSISGGTCVFTNDYTINNTVLYDFTVTPVGTTCNGSNGSVTLQTNGGVGPFIYTITTKQPISSSNNSVTFNNLPTGSYTATVLDTSSNCTQSLPFMIDSSESVDFYLNKNDATTGSNGSIQTYITSGTPPFTYLWSNGQTTPNISGLNDGDYTLTVTDINGCVKQRTVTINGYDKVSSYQSYTICDDIFADGGNIKKGIKQMYIEGYFDSISDDYNCVLDSATFIAQVTVGNDITSLPFYSSNSLTQYPSDNQWLEFVKSILQDYPNIGDVIIDYVGNTITINTNCDPESLFNTNVIVRLRIEYFISCEKCNLSCDIDYTQPPTDFCTGNLITNSTFDTNLVGWSYTIPGNWNWSSQYGGSAMYGGANGGGILYQNILTVGATYNISFTLYNILPNDGSYVKIYVGTNVSSLIQTNGQVSLTLTCTGNDSFGIEGFFQSGVNPNSGVYIDNICMVLVIPPSQTPTPTITVTPTPTITITPTNTVTPTPTNTLTLYTAGISQISDPSDACNEIIDSVCWVSYIAGIPGLETISTSSVIYNNAGGTIEFPGDGVNYWRIQITGSTRTTSAILNNNGTVGSPISICP